MALFEEAEREREPHMVPIDVQQSAERTQMRAKLLETQDQLRTDQVQVEMKSQLVQEKDQTHSRFHERARNSRDNDKDKCDKLETDDHEDNDAFPSDERKREILADIRARGCVIKDSALSAKRKREILADIVEKNRKREMSAIERQPRRKPSAVEEDLFDELFGTDDDVVELGGTVVRGKRRYCCLGCYNRGIGSKVYTELWQCYSCGLDLRARRGPGTEGIAGSQCLPKPT